MGVLPPGSNPTSLTGNGAQAKAQRSHPIEEPSANITTAATGPAKCHHCPRAPCPAPALPKHSGDTSPALPSAKWAARLGDKESDIWGGGCGRGMSKHLSNQCSQTLNRGCSLGGCQQQTCLSRVLYPPMLVTSAGSILSPIPVPLFLVQHCGTSAMPWRCHKSPRTHTTTFHHLTPY